MDPIAACAEDALRRHPAPALRLSELLELVRDAGLSARLDRDELRRRLACHPETFRFLDPWRGPWRRSGHRTERELGRADPWVVVVSDPADGGMARPDALGMMRVSVRWLVREVDTRSTQDLNRAHRMVLEEAEARKALKRAA